MEIVLIHGVLLFFFSWQQNNGSVQAHGTGVYEDLPCGLVSDGKIYSCS